jgi:FlaG/FlaF family flagellin (archaellin)
MKFKRDNMAVSEIIGTILLLTIAVFIFSALYISILLPVFFPDSNSAPVSVDIIGTLEGNTIILEHRGGDKLALDSMFLVTVGGIEQEFKVGDYLNIESKEDGYWTVGERIVFPAGDTAGIQVEITIIDGDSNYVALFGILQDGEIYTDPTVTTLDATEITTSSAKLWMNYYLKGHSGFVCFSYKPSVGSWTNTSWQAKSDGGSYNEIVSGLNPCERYYFKAQLKYDTVEIEGPENNFTTSWTTLIDTISPYMETIAPLSITATGSSNLDNISLFYRWSDDNSSWGHSGETEYNTIIVDTSSASENSAQEYTYDSWSHTTNDNNDRILIVSYAYENDDAIPTTISTVEYNGSSLTQIRQDKADEGTSHEFSELWYLLNPPTGSHNIFVNFSATCRGGAGGAITAYNVSQKAPTADEGTFNTGTPIDMSDTITTTIDNCLIVSACGEGYLRTPHSFGSGQIQIYNTAAYSNGVSGSYEMRTSQGSDTISHAWGADGYRAAISLACFEPTNTTWGNGSNWIVWSDASNPDTSSPWSWNFDFPNGTGFYEFHSIGMKDDDIEDPPGSADAICRYNPS